MSITKCPGHMRSLKLNFSATVLTLGLKAKIFENFRKFKTLLSESFGGNCARAPRLTAVCVGPGQRSRFLVLTKRSATSGDENAPISKRRD